MTQAAKPIALLIDGDVFAFQGAASAEFTVELEDTYHRVAHMSDAKHHVLSNITELAKQLKATKVINTLSCPTRRYWRHDVIETYKGGRKNVKGPISLGGLKEWMQTVYESYIWPNMEADDVLGVLATDPSFLPEYTKIVVSIDKDMKTIPDTYIYNPDKDYQPWFNHRGEADMWFLAQAIGGDFTDGYSGVHGISTDGAEKFLIEPFRYEQYEHTFKSGPRKGVSEPRWRKVEASEIMWENILTLYAKAGQTPEDALDNARVARILRHEEYNQKTNEVTLWNPETAH